MSVAVLALGKLLHLAGYNALLFLIYSNWGSFFRVKMVWVGDMSDAVLALGKVLHPTGKRFFIHQNWDSFWGKSWGSRVKFLRWV